MTKPWEKFKKNDDGEAPEETNEAEELDFDMSPAEEVEEEDPDGLDFNVDTSEEVVEEESSSGDETGFSFDDMDEESQTAIKAQVEEEEDETAATMIVSKDSNNALEELSQNESEEDLDKTINRLVGLDDDGGIDLGGDEDETAKTVNKLPSNKPDFTSIKTDNLDDDDPFGLEGDDDEDAATRVLNLGNVGLESKNEENMFGDEDEGDEDEATRVLSVGKPAASVEPLEQSGTFTDIDEGFSVSEEEEELDAIPEPTQEVHTPQPTGGFVPGGLKSIDSDELTRLQATIRQLREERDELLNKIGGLQENLKMTESESLGLKAEMDELKIELTILRKRNTSEMESVKYNAQMATEKKEILEEKNRHLQKEFDRLNQKVRMELNQVKQREKELESQLELVTMDSESQVRSRDMKILELKRHIDQLEFNMENASIKEHKSREDKVKLEEKLTNVIKNLRGSISMLEDDLDLDEELVQRIKKL